MDDVVKKLRELRSETETWARDIVRRAHEETAKQEAELRWKR